jgi:putative oxidoreductase
MFTRIVKFEFLPASKDAGLLFLRVFLCGSLFLKHGTEKIFTFSQMSQHFPALLGLSPSGSLFCAMLGDAICTVLAILGLATRWAVLISIINIFVAWSLVHHFMYFGHGADHGEVIVLYLAGLLTLFVAGPGRFSIDALLKSSNK